MESDTYQKQVNALIRIAVAKANLVAGTQRDKAALWSRVYHGTMDREAHIRGLRRMSYQAANADMH